MYRFMTCNLVKQRKKTFLVKYKILFNEHDNLHGKILKTISKR